MEVQHDRHLRTTDHQPYREGTRPRWDHEFHASIPAGVSAREVRGGTFVQYRAASQVRPEGDFPPGGCGRRRNGQPDIVALQTAGSGQAERRCDDGSEVAIALDAVKFREKLILGLAIFGGFRPGEILGLQRKHVAGDADEIEVQQRVYRGELDNPKTDASTRTAAVPPKNGGAASPLAGDGGTE